MPNVVGDGSGQDRWYAAVVVDLKRETSEVDAVLEKLWSLYRETKFDLIRERLGPILEAIAPLRMFMETKVVEWEMARDGKLPKPERLHHDE